MTSSKSREGLENLECHKTSKLEGSPGFERLSGSSKFRGYSPSVSSPSLARERTVGGWERKRTRNKKRSERWKGTGSKNDEVDEQREENSELPREMNVIDA